MAEVREELYRDAARAEVRTLLADDQRTGWTVADAERTAAGLMQVPSFRAVVESAYRAGYGQGRDDEAAEVDLAMNMTLPTAGTVGKRYRMVPIETHADPLDHVVAHHEDRTFAEIADVKRGEDQ